jgi:hypothetical protein
VTGEAFGSSERLQGITVEPLALLVRLLDRRRRAQDHAPRRSEAARQSRNMCSVRSMPMPSAAAAATRRTHLVVRPSVVMAAITCPSQAVV